MKKLELGSGSEEEAEKSEEEPKKEDPEENEAKPEGEEGAEVPEGEGAEKNELQVAYDAKIA